MPTIDSYHSEDFLRLLLQGPSGSGKTCLTFQIPGLWVFDLDHNLGGPLRYARKHGLPLPLGYDVVDIDENGKEVPLREQFLQLKKKLAPVLANPDVKALSFDSGSRLCDILIEEVLRQQNKNAISDYKDGRQFWGFFAVAGKQLMAQLMSIRKHVVVPIHEKFNKNAEGQIVWPVDITWTGQVGDDMGRFFTDVWRCETESNAGKVEYKIRTAPSYQYSLKNGLDLPTTMKFEWPVIEAKLKSK